MHSSSVGFGEEAQAAKLRPVLARELRTGTSPCRCTGVGRTNLILLAMGVLSMVALSIMMQYVMGVRRDRMVDPLVQELMQSYGSRLEQEPRLIRRAEGGQNRVVLEIHPIVGIQRRPLALQMGEQVWRCQRQPVDAVRVVCLGFGEEQSEHFDVPKPYMTPPPSK